MRCAGRAASTKSRAYGRRAAACTQAIAKTDYRIANSSSMRIEGAKDERALLQIVASNYCEIVLDRRVHGDRSLRARQHGVDRRRGAAHAAESGRHAASRGARARTREQGPRKAAQVRSARVHASAAAQALADPVACRARACEGHERAQALRASRLRRQHARGPCAARRIRLDGRGREHRRGRRDRGNRRAGLARQSGPLRQHHGRAVPGDGSRVLHRLRAQGRHLLGADVRDAEQKK